MSTLFLHWTIFLSLILPFPICFSQTRPIQQVFVGDSKLDKPYGITSHITWYGYDYDKYQVCIEEIAATGTNYIRTDFNQGSINWGKKNQSFTVWDNVVTTSKAKGVQMTPLVYPTRYDKYSKKEDEAYSRYLKDCLTRYGKYIDTWEIWNEMDIMNASDGKVAAAEYVPMLKSSYNIIKAYNPKQKVLLGAIGDLGKSYFEELLQNGAANYFDVMNIHYYSARNMPEAILPFYEKTAMILTKYHVGKPMWLTETGYSTFGTDSPEDPDKFYTELLPKVYRKLGIKCSDVELAVLLDTRVNKYLRNQDNPAIYSGFKGVRSVGLVDLATLDIKKFPVLMILFGESFPMGHFKGLETYVRRGGTVVFPEGGALLYYDLDIKSNELKPVGKSYYKKLHVGCMFTWEAEAKARGVKSKMKGLRVSPSFASNYSWTDEELKSPKYFTRVNLSTGDEMIPILEGYDEGFSSPVAVCYKLNSDLKGNVIIQSRTNSGYKISESLQAIRYPRLYLLSFASGVDKVFSYCLKDRSQENGGYGILRKDLSRKPSFYALKTLIEKCPTGSSRPVVMVNNHRYIASWIRPDGKKVYAVWSDRVGLESVFSIRGFAKFFDCFGNRINNGVFKFTPSVVYIEEAQSVSF